MDMLSILPKYSYQYTPINNGGVGLGLDTKKDFDEDREKRIQLYATVGKKVTNVSAVNPC